MCSNSHVADKWCSQPVLSRGLHGGDLMIASSILFSGNNFNKMELFAKFLQTGFPSQSSFTRLQRRYLVTSVNDFWAEKQEEMVMELANQDLVLLGKNVFLSLVQITQNTPWNMIYTCNHSTSIISHVHLFFVILSCRWLQDGQPWALCSILHIYIYGEFQQENSCHQHLGQTRDR